MTFVQTWQRKTGYDVMQFTNWLGIGRNKYYSWVNRQGQENQASGVPPKHHWLNQREAEIFDQRYQKLAQARDQPAILNLK